MPDDVNAKSDHGLPSRSGLVNPWLRAEAKDEVDNALIVEENGEDHADRNRVCDVRDEENRLEQLFERLDRVQTDGDEKRNDDRNWDGDESDDQRIGQSILNNVHREIDCFHGAISHDHSANIRHEGAIALPAIERFLALSEADQTQDGSEVIESKTRVGLRGVIVVL